MITDQLLDILPKDASFDPAGANIILVLATSCIRSKLLELGMDTLLNDPQLFHHGEKCPLSGKMSTMLKNLRNVEICPPYYKFSAILKNVRHIEKCPPY